LQIHSKVIALQEKPIQGIIFIQQMQYKMKTNKLFLTGLIFLMIGSSASAQLRFGLRGEMGVNKPSLKKGLFSVENMNAFKVGPTMEFIVPLIGIGVEGSLLYSNEKMNVNDEKEILIKEISSHYIDVPVNLKYKFGIISPLKLYLAAGPYAQIKIAGDGSEKLKDVFDGIDDKKFQAGLNFGVGADIIKRIQIGFNYRMKLTDDYSTNKPEWSDLLNDNKGFWSVTAGVYF
jgi:opacity protein-like surface antigen